MQNYKDNENNIYALESTEFKHLLPTDCIAITQNEADLISHPPLTLAQSQDKQIKLIENDYTTAIQKDVDYMGKLFQADMISQDRLLKCLVALSGTVPDGFYWLSSDNSEIIMTFAQLQNLSSLMMSQGWSAFQKMKTLKDKIRSSMDVNSVSVIIW